VLTSKKNELKKRLGNKSTKTGTENRMKVFLTIAEEPMSFKDMLEKLKMTKPTLTSHLKTLEKEKSIYKDTVKSYETSNSEEVGKVVYRVSVSQIHKMLEEALSLYDILSRAFDLEAITKESRERTGKIPEDNLRKLTADEEIKEVHQKLEEHKKAMVDTVSDYLTRREERRRLRAKDREGV
jgi:predicted transcriptional regulator